MPSHVPLFINSVTETKLADLANSVDLDEVAHNEPPHLDLHCLPLVFELSILYSLDLTFFLKISRRKFCRLLFGS